MQHIKNKFTGRLNKFDLYLYSISVMIIIIFHEFMHECLNTFGLYSCLNFVFTIITFLSFPFSNVGGACQRTGQIVWDHAFIYGCPQLWSFQSQCNCWGIYLYIKNNWTYIEIKNRLNSKITLHIHARHLNNKVINDRNIYLYRNMYVCIHVFI